MPEPCPICGNQSNAGSPTFRGRKEVTCETCGQFQVSDAGEAALKRLTSEDRRAQKGEQGLARSRISGRTYFSDPRRPLPIRRTRSAPCPRTAGHSSWLFSAARLSRSRGSAPR